MGSQSPLLPTNCLQLNKGSIKGGGSTFLATSSLSSSPVYVVSGMLFCWNTKRFPSLCWESRSWNMFPDFVKD